MSAPASRSWADDFSSFARPKFDPAHLFHASHESGIKAFYPRLPPAPEVGQVNPCVWSTSYPFLANYLAPRDCPRIIFGRGPTTTKADVDRFIGKSKAARIVIIEKDWRSRMETMPIWIYAFEAGLHWNLFDPNSGVYVSEISVVPERRHRIASPAEALAAHGAELREVDNLWPMIEAITRSTLSFSIIRKRNAQLG
jgi:hypothetical protein